MKNKAFTEIPGGFNDVPPNFREVTEAEFSKSWFFTYPSDIREYRQMIRDSEGKPLQSVLFVTLFMMSDGSGFGLSRDYYAEKVKFYKFEVCQHDWRPMTDDEMRERGLRRMSCQHESVCSKCGYVRIVDSSD